VEEVGIFRVFLVDVLIVLVGTGAGMRQGPVPSRRSIKEAQRKGVLSTQMELMTMMMLLLFSFGVTKFSFIPFQSSSGSEEAKSSSLLFPAEFGPHDIPNRCAILDLAAAAAATGFL